MSTPTLCEQIPSSSGPSSRQKRLTTRPARAPVNVSTLPWQAAPHDSGSVWATNPSPSDSFTRLTSPVYPGARGETDE
jgi:hypothetical protein